MPLHPSHIETWNSLLNGDASSLEELYNHHYIGLLNYGIKLSHQPELTKDCIFQLFLNLWDNRVKLPAVINVRSYLTTCLRRELLVQINKKNTIKDRVVWDNIYPDVEFSYEDFLLKQQQQKDNNDRIMAAFKNLTDREKELLRLKFFEDLDYDEIAVSCNITKRTAYNMIHTALKTLRQSLNADNKKKKAGYILTALKCIFF